jgi:hypothetical protein
VSHRRDAQFGDIDESLPLSAVFAVFAALAFLFAWRVLPETGGRKLQ